MFSAKMTSAICLMTLLTHAAGQKACFQDYALASSLAGCVSPFDSTMVLVGSTSSRLSHERNLGSAPATSLSGNGDGGGGAWALSGTQLSHVHVATPMDMPPALYRLYLSDN